MWDPHQAACCMPHPAALDSVKAHTLRCLQPLSVELGPGLLSMIFDGIQRPLKSIALSSGDVFIPRGVDVPALDRKKAWEFNPSKIKVGIFCSIVICLDDIELSPGPSHGVHMPCFRLSSFRCCTAALSCNAGAATCLLLQLGSIIQPNIWTCAPPAPLQEELYSSACWLLYASSTLSEHPISCLLSLLQTGDRLTGGDIFGLVHENTLIDHKIMVQPGAQGTVSWIAPQGEYTLTDKVLELEFAGNKKVSG